MQVCDVTLLQRGVVYLQHGDCNLLTQNDATLTSHQNGYIGYSTPLSFIVCCQNAANARR